MASFKDYKLRLEIEVSNHDGYCSGNECEYSVITKNITVRVPSSYDMSVWDDKVYDPPCWGRDEDIVGSRIENSIPNTDGGSGYCVNSVEAERHGIDKHDTRVHVAVVGKKGDTKREGGCCKCCGCKN
jgi:hypothetical protein